MTLLEFDFFGALITASSVIQFICVNDLDAKKPKTLGSHLTK